MREIFISYYGEIHYYILEVTIMKKTIIWGIIAMIAAGVTSGASSMYGWNRHKDYVEKTKIEI